MLNALLDSPLLRNPRPWWYPFLALFVTLYGIFALGWNLQPVVVLFWIEVMMMGTAALVRCLFALDGRPIWVNLIPRIITTGFGVALLMGMLMLAVAFTIDIFDTGMRTDGFEKIPNQVRILAAGYVLGLLFHYFLNGRYKTATPIGELMQTLVHLLILLVLLMAITMHLLPAYPNLEKAKWVGVAVVAVKFAVDWLFLRVQAPLREKLGSEALDDIK